MALLTTAAIIGGTVAAISAGTNIVRGIKKGKEAKAKEERGRKALEDIDLRSAEMDDLMKAAAQKEATAMGDVKAADVQAQKALRQREMGIQRHIADIRQRQRQLSLGGRLADVRRSFKEGMRGRSIGEIAQAIRQTGAAVSEIQRGDRATELALTGQVGQMEGVLGDITAKRAGMGLEAASQRAGIAQGFTGLQAGLEKTQSQRALDLQMYPATIDLGQGAQMRQQSEELFNLGTSQLVSAGTQFATAGLGDGGGGGRLKRNPVDGSKSSYGGTYEGYSWADANK